MALSDESVRLRLKKVNPSAKPFEWAGVNPASRTLLAYLKQFAAALQAATSEADMTRLASRYEDGKLLRRAVTLAGNVSGGEARAILESLGSVGEDKLRNFPFLREETNRALQKLAASGA